MSLLGLSSASLADQEICILLGITRADEVLSATSLRSVPVLAEPVVS